uniref:Galectin n=1 Tax=Plectus sambesii TaxID=2011161 RepID=A0A914UTV9_9BILA
MADYSKHPNYKALPIPFKTQISEPLQNGQTIHTSGTIKEDAKRINFNLHFGSAEFGASDLPMHLSIRFDEGKIVYNTYQAGEWSAEEDRVKNPFKAGGEFDLRVRALDEKFHVYANRHEVAKFDQRIPLAQVSHVSIDGDLSELHLFHFGGRKFDIPTCCDAPMATGRRVDISAIPKGDCFTINLFHADKKEHALHFSVRFEEDAVVRNATTDGKWGNEEREGKFPFKKNQVCDITIANEEYSMQLFVDGQRFGTFAHRGNPNDINGLTIEGDVDVMSILFN